MSGRRRALVLALAAAFCAALAALSAVRGASGDESRYGALREVVVARASLEAGARLGARELDGALEVRRVPELFVPADALVSTAQVAEQRLASAVPAGSYLLASHFAAAGETAAKPRPGGFSGERRAVEIRVAGGASLAGRAASGRPRVDVVVTSEPGPGGGGGRTYVAAADVALLGIRALGDPVDPVSGESYVATLALRRAQALRLIQAESYARSVRLIGS